MCSTFLPNLKKINSIQILEACLQSMPGFIEHGKRYFYPNSFIGDAWLNPNIPYTTSSNV